MTPAHLVPVGSVIRHHAGAASGEYRVTSVAEHPRIAGVYILGIALTDRYGKALNESVTYRADQRVEVVSMGQTEGEG